MGHKYTISRRQALLGAVGSATGLFAAAPAAVDIETHVHLFDPSRVPYAPDAPYKPAAYPLEEHLKLVEAAGLAHSIIVHPEPYQAVFRVRRYWTVLDPTACHPELRTSPLLRAAR